MRVTRSMFKCREDEVEVVSDNDQTNNLENYIVENNNCTKEITTEQQTINKSIYDLDFSGKQLTRFKTRSVGIPHCDTLNIVFINLSKKYIPQEQINCNNSWNNHYSLEKVKWRVEIRK